MVFETWRAYFEFENEVKKDRRYIRTAKAERFLDAVRVSSKRRTSHLSKGRRFWRAQAGFDWRHDEQIDDEVPSAFPPDRMKPLSDRAMEGRANPRGIPVLYLGTNKEAAMSEVRPWLGSMISLAQFETLRDLTVVDCTRDARSKTEFFLREPQENEREQVVWSSINRAFTTPTTRSDDQDAYVATQILAELFKDNGFDGVAYRSAFGESSVNLALFDIGAAEIRNCQLYELTSARFNFNERDNPYWVRKKATASSESKKGS